MLVCPICKKKLKKIENKYQCEESHSFDIARQGYVNFSLRQKKEQGDNARMIHSRTQFLEKDYYDFMRQSVASILCKYDVKILFDAGCGQGYYTKSFANICSTVIGADLSKEGVRYAAAHDKKCFYFVSSIFDLPLENECVDGVTSIFVPNAYEEVHRILKKNGIWIVVGPGPKHCWELKELLYGTPYENSWPESSMEGFEQVEQVKINNKYYVDNVWSLLEMTPYRYKTGKKGLDAAKECPGLNVTFEFIITVWRKK